MQAVLTPQQTRERLVEFYMRTFARAYGHADRGAIERKVVAELELVETARRAPRAPRAPRARQSRADPLAELQAETGTKLAKGVTCAARPGEAYLPRILHANPMRVTEQWACACARVARILQGTGGAGTFTAGVTNAEVPKLAARFLETFAFYMTRGKPAPLRGVDHNPFRGLSDRDASRAYMRAVIDICDASTGVAGLGHWYVK